MLTKKTGPIGSQPIEPQSQNTRLKSVFGNSDVTTITTSSQTDTNRISDLTDDQERRQMHAAALFYARRGWYVFPVHNPIFDDAGNCTGCTCESWRRANGDPDYVCAANHRGKCPRVRWSEKSTIDAEQIRKWWGNPRAWNGQIPNIGIDCGKSGILTLDVDNYKEHAGDISDLLTIAEQSTVTVKSGSGGLHLIYDRQGKPYGNNVGNLPAGIDVRGVGGYIVAAPSLHKSGRRYTYEEGWGPRDVALLPIPLVLDEMLAAAHAKAVTSSPATFTAVTTDDPDLSRWHLSQRISETINNPAPHGQRSEADMSVCVSLVYAGATDDDILSVFEHCPIGTDGKFAEAGRGYLAHTIGRARSFVADNPRPDQLIEGAKEYFLTQDIGLHVPDEMKAKYRNPEGEILSYQYRARSTDTKISSRVLDVMQSIGRVDAVIMNAYQVVRTENSNGVPVQIATHKTVGKVLQRLAWFFDAEPTEKPHTWRVSLTDAFKVVLSTFPVSKDTSDLIFNNGDTGKVLTSTFDQWKADDAFGSGTSGIVRKRLRSEVQAEATESRSAGNPLSDAEMQASYRDKLSALAAGLGSLAILVIHSLLDAGGSGATVPELAEAHGLTASSVGAILRKLRTIGLVESERRYRLPSVHYIEPHAFEWIAAHEEQFRTYKAGVKRLDRALESAQHRADQLAEQAETPEDKTAAQRRAGRAANKRFATMQAIYPSWDSNEQAKHIYGSYTPKRMPQAPTMPAPGDLAWHRLTELTGKVLLTADEFGELQSLDRVLGAGVNGRFGEVSFDRN